ncbi:hypothetical protein [Streptomyces sp. NPDC026673]|uniref:hypothetical protein n=1 Tax=Streptomyces sp. NPDC026673 TaxID=3155724 RepID=UPI0033DF12B1
MRDAQPPRGADPPDDRAPAGGARTGPASGPAHDGDGDGTVWLIGLRHRAGSGAFVRHYYVIAGTVAAVEALRRAHLSAMRPAECRLRGDAAVDATWAEVRRLIHDALGRFHLVGHGY